MSEFKTELNLIQGGNPVQALIGLAGKLRSDSSCKDLIRITCTALLAALNQKEALDKWDSSEKSACYKALLLQSNCPTRPLILAHEAASNITSGNSEATGNLAAELSRTLLDLLAAGPEKNPDFANLVLFLITVRGVLKNVTSEDRITSLHFEWFDKFSTADLALPYSTMFNADYFGINRDEILEYHWGKPDRISCNPALGPAHLLFFEWLAGHDYFCAFDNADLKEFLGAHLPDQTKTPAARMLVLRHWLPNSLFTVQDLSDLGLADIVTLATYAAGVRKMISKGRTAHTATERLHKTSYNVLQAGWTTATHSLPFLNREQRRVRVAICLSGQLRGYEAALAQWRKTILAHVDSTFFIHSWHGIGRSDAQPFRHTLPFAGKHFARVYRQLALNLGYDAIRARYPALFVALAAGSLANKDELKALYDTDYVILEDDTAEPFAGYSSQQKMHYKIHAADQMAQATGKFDLHVRLRPDLGIRLAGFDWRDLRSACQSRPVLFAEKPYGLHYANLLIGDQCAIADPETMAIYAGTWESFPNFSKAGLAACPVEFKGHVSLALCSWLQGIAVEKAPIRFGQLEEASPLSTTDILIALEQDGRGDDADHQLIAAARQDS